MKVLALPHPGTEINEAVVAHYLKRLGTPMQGSGKQWRRVAEESGVSELGLKGTSWKKRGSD